MPKRKHTDNNVRHVKQRRDDDCGPTCVEMVTGHDIKDIYKQIRIFDRGTYAPQLAKYLFDNKFDVKLTYFNPYLTNVYHEHSMSKAQLLNNLIESKDLTNKQAIKYMKQCASDYPITIEMPTKERFIKKLDEGYVIIPLLTSCFLDKDEVYFNQHYVVITGYKDDKFIVNDPSYKRKQSFKMDHMLYGIVAATYWSYDCGLTIYVKS